MTRMRLCHRNEIPDGAAHGFLPGEAARRKVIVVNRAGRLDAYVDSCPHYRGGTPMSWRENAYLSGDGLHLACHAHGALFDIDTGDCVSGPCLGRKLTRVPLTEDAEGYLHVPAQLAGRAATQS